MKRKHKARVQAEALERQAENALAQARSHGQLVRMWQDRAVERGERVRHLERRLADATARALKAENDVDRVEEERDTAAARAEAAEARVKFLESVNEGLARQAEGAHERAGDSRRRADRAEALLRSAEAALDGALEVADHLLVRMRDGSRA